MLYAFGFEHIGVVVSDLYFLDPHPSPGQEGAERGVRLEVRMLDRGALKGSIYSAQPIGIDRPIWRADLLESVAGPFGSFDRTHHHPAFNDISGGELEFPTRIGRPTWRDAQPRVGARVRSDGCGGRGFERDVRARRMALLLHLDHHRDHLARQ